MIYQLYRKYIQMPEHRGKFPFSRWLGKKIFPKEGIIFDVDKDIRLYLHPLDWIEFHLLKTGSYEPLTINFLERNISPGNNVLLAGVNLGLHVICASKFVGDKGCVIGVEPQPRSLYRAFKNIQLNKLHNNIKLVSSALGKEPSLTPMDDAPTENSAQAALNHSNSENPFYVQVETVPILLEKLGIKKIDVMLLDVEGYEMNVLEGMDSANLPPLLIIEINLGLWNKDNQINIYNRLASIGYNCFTLLGKPANAEEFLPESNAVAVLKGNELPHFC